MTDSSSDSDCFESADEGFDDENIVKNDNIKYKCGRKESGRCSPIPSDVSLIGDQTVISEMSQTASSLQYRKRPERGKSASKPVQSALPNNRKTSLNEQTFKTDIKKPDDLIQDITSNLSKNFTKGFSTIQQTSSSIKDLVISSLPVTNLKESQSKFSYDDEEEISSHVFDFDDDSNADNTESEESVKASQQPPQTESDIAIGGQTEISDVTDLLEEALNSNLTTKIGALKISESNNDEEIKEECFPNEHVESGYNVVLVEGSGDGNCEKAQYKIDPKKQEEISEETKDLINDMIQDGYNKNEAEVLQDMSVSIEPHKVTEYQKENINESRVETRNEGNNPSAEFNEKDGWDSSELELEGLDEIEESSNDASICAMESEVKEEFKPKIKETAQKVPDKEISDDNDGWDDFDIDDEELEVVKNENNTMPSGDTKTNNQHISEERNQRSQQPSRDENKNFGNDTKWSGWDNFGEKQETKQKSGWNLGSWGVNALLNTATSVTQGLTNVIEAGLGVPDPETLARMELETGDNMNVKTKTESVQEKESSPSKADDTASSGINLFPTFGITNLVAGVTKNIVENTKVHEIGTKVIAGGLDTLESFGKKTMEVLQEGDPGLKKKRALLLGSDKPVLSQVLREAKSKAEMEDRRMEEKQMAKMCHFETLFDDYQGLIHLEALEMLSRQCELKLEQMKAALPTSEVDDLTGILDEVKELCVIDEDEFKANYSTMVDFKISLMKAVEPIKNEISTQKIVQVYEDLDAWLKCEGNTTKSARGLFQKAMSTLAELTAATVAQFHKGGELLSIKEHRKTVEEADALLQMTGFLCCEINSISQKFLKLHTSCLTENDREIAIKIKEEANNATSYIKDAFNLLIPVLQLGAAT